MPPFALVGISQDRLVGAERLVLLMRDDQWFVISTAACNIPNHPRAAPAGSPSIGIMIGEGDLLSVRASITFPSIAFCAYLFFELDPFSSLARGPGTSSSEGASQSAVWRIGGVELAR